MKLQAAERSRKTPPECTLEGPIASKTRNRPRQANPEKKAMNHRMSRDFRISGAAKGEKTTPAEKVAKTAIVGPMGRMRGCCWSTMISNESAQNCQPCAHSK